MLIFTEIIYSLLYLYSLLTKKWELQLIIITQQNLFILVTTSKYIYVHISLKLLISMLLTQDTVNIKYIFKNKFY